MSSSSAQHTATHCNTLQHTSTHCNTLPHTATHCITLQNTAKHCKTLQHSASHCTTLHHTTPHCITLHHTAPHRTTPYHTAPHCTSLQHTAAHCNTLQHTATHCTTLHHSAPHCNTLHHTHTFLTFVHVGCGQGPARKNRRSQFSKAPISYICYIKWLKIWLFRNLAKGKMPAVLRRLKFSKVQITTSNDCGADFSEIPHPDYYIKWLWSWLFRNSTSLRATCLLCCAGKNSQKLQLLRILESHKLL